MLLEMSEACVDFGVIDANYCPKHVHVKIQNQSNATPLVGLGYHNSDVHSC